MIYLFDNLNGFSDELFWRSLEVIPDERGQKAMKFRNMIDRKLSVIAYLLLMFGLKHEYGIVEQLTFKFGENRKPYLESYPHIFFNISHCKYGVVCAISNREIGIDIEEVSNYDEELANYICNQDENKSLVASQNPALDFCKLWTMKESVLKFTGSGINTDLKSVLGNSHYRIETICSSDNSYVISVCQNVV